MKKDIRRAGQHEPHSGTNEGRQAETDIQRAGGLLFFVRGRGRGRAVAVAVAMAMAVAGRVAGVGCPGGRVGRVAGWLGGWVARWPWPWPVRGRVAGWPGGRVAGWVAGWPRPWRLFAIRLHTKQLVFSCISGNLPIHISAKYTRRPGAKQQAWAAKEEQVA